MDRNKLDNALLRKVEQARIEPPSDMWNRIASTLSDQRLTASDEASGAAETVQPRVIKIRRTKGLRWRYAAAVAAAIVCAVVLGYRMGGVEDLVIAEKIPAGIEIVSVEAVEQTLANKIQAAVRQSTTTGQQTGMIAQITSEMNADPDLIQYIEAFEVDDAPKNTESDPADHAASESADNDREMTQSKSSDMRSEGGVPVYNAAYGAEAVGRIKRATPLAVSLYAGNFGGGKTVQNMTGGTLRAESNDPMVYEMGSDIMADVSRQSAIYHSVSLKHKFPISFGVNVSKGLTKRLSAETGLMYSYLYSESETPTGNNQYKHEQKLHYLGIPVGVKYDLFKRPLYNLYASGGVLFEMCVSGQYVQTLYNNGIAGISSARRMNVYGVQSSVNMQVGAEFKMSKSFSIYLEPGVSYYFKSTGQPENYRTENPINISLKAGVRMRMN